MERLKRGLVFWVLLVFAMSMPGSAQTTVKKHLYRAQIKVDGAGAGKGSSTILESPTGYEYMVRTHAYPGQVVTKVSLWSEDWRSNPNATEVVICGTALAGPCTYASDGNVDLDGSINATMLGVAYVSGAMFRNALRNGTLSIYLDSGDLGIGTYERIL